MSDENPPCILGIGTSRTLRPHWMLCELGVDYSYREIIPRTDSMNDLDFLRLSTRGKVPIFEHGTLVIGESAAIVGYLAERYRERLELAPPVGSLERARFDEMCSFVMTEVDATLYIIRRHEGLANLYGAAPAAVEAAKAYVVRQMGVVEAWLGDQPHLLGEAFSAADLLLATCSAWAQMLGIPLPDAVDAHRVRTTERKAFRRAFERNFPPAARAMLSGAATD